MARTRDDQGRRILEAASGLLSEEGASALSVRRIATAAGCSTMGLYSRFGGKDGVVDELYAEGFERLITAMKANPVTDDTLADLRRCATCYRETALANATHYMVMFGGAVPGFVPSDASHAIAHDAFGGLVAKVARCTDAGVLVGSTRRDRRGALGLDPRVGHAGAGGYQPAAERSGRALRACARRPLRRVLTWLTN